MIATVEQAEAQLAALEKQYRRARDMLHELEGSENATHGQLANAEAELAEAQVAADLGDSINVDIIAARVEDLQQRIRDTPLKIAALERRIHEYKRDIQRGTFALDRARVEAAREAEEHLRERAFTAMRAAFEAQYDYLRLLAWQGKPFYGKPGRHGVVGDSDALTVLIEQCGLTPELTRPQSTLKPTTEQVKHLLETKDTQ